MESQGYGNVTTQQLNLVTSGDYFQVVPIDGQTTDLYFTLAINRCFIAVAGFLGNGLALFTTAMCKKMQTTTNVLNLQLAVMAVLQSGFNIPHSIYQMLTMRGGSVLLCRFMAHLLMWETVVNALTFSLVAFNRYVLIIKKRATYDRLFKRRNLVGITCTCWLWGVMVVLLPDFGFGKMGYNHRLIFCSFLIESDEQHTYFYALFISMTTITPSVTATFFCYTKITLKLWEVRRNRVTVKTIVQPDTKSRRRSETLRTVVVLIAMFLVYMSVWMPFGTMVTSDLRLKWHPMIYAVLGHTVLIQNIFFPVFYITSSRTHREAHKLAVCCRWNELKAL